MLGLRKRVPESEAWAGGHERASATGKCAHWVRGAPQGLVGRREEEAGGLRDR